MGELQFEQPGEVRRNYRVVNRRPVNMHWNLEGMNLTF